MHGDALNQVLRAVSLSLQDAMFLALEAQEAFCLFWHRGISLQGRNDEQGSMEFVRRLRYTFSLVKLISASGLHDEN